MTAPSLSEIRAALPAATRDAIEALLATARVEKLAVHLVGGPVRDMLLGLPIRDVDLIVEPREHRTAAWLAEHAAPPGMPIVAHGRFGTVTIGRGEGQVDIATVRSETYSHPGALPSVEPGTLETDLERRDFTVNAMALPLSPTARRKHSGIVDPKGGLDDLHAKVLRIHHPRSFSDDPTRALRAARLAPRLGFGLTPSSRTALRAALREGAFGRVSGDRLRRELEKLFADARLDMNPAEALRCLASWHVLPALEPGLELPRVAVTPLRRLGRSLAEPPFPIRGRPGLSGLCLWFAPLDPGLRRHTGERLGLRGEALIRVVAFPKSRDRWLAQLGRARGRGAIDAVLRDIPDEELLALHAGSPPALARRLARWAGEDRRRRLPLDGDDLTALGLSGPAVGRGLARIRTAFLDGDVKDREEALALARELSRRARPASRKRTKKAGKPASPKPRRRKKA